MKRDGYKFEATPEEVAQDQRRLAEVFRLQAAAGRGRFTPAGNT